jgi:hypothetical protein
MLFSPSALGDGILDKKERTIKLNFNGCLRRRKCHFLGYKKIILMNFVEIQDKLYMLFENLYVVFHKETLWNDMISKGNEPSLSAIYDNINS